MTPQTSSYAKLSEHLRSQAKSLHRPALVPYITAGYPNKQQFIDHLVAMSKLAGLIEVGVPFSDPMADGVTIQKSSKQALAQGVNLPWILDTLASLKSSLACPIALMSYLNPLLAPGLHTLAAGCHRAGVSTLIVPDLPLEESAPLRASLNQADVGLVQFVSPVTPADRARSLVQAAQGFVYVVTITGTTGSASADQGALSTLLDTTRAMSPVAICAGFGIRTRQHIQALAGHADGAIIGSALIDAIDQGQRPADFLQSLVN
jgi:tryptophan synthase alpha chain